MKFSFVHFSDRECWIRQKYEKRKYLCPLELPDFEGEEEPTDLLSDRFHSHISQTEQPGAEGQDSQEESQQPCDIAPPLKPDKPQTDQIDPQPSPLSENASNHTAILEAKGSIDLEKDMSVQSPCRVAVASSDSETLSLTTAKRKVSEPPALLHTSSDGVGSRSIRPRSSQFSQSRNLPSNNSSEAIVSLLVPSKSVGSELSLEFQTQSAPHQRSRAKTSLDTPQHDNLVLDDEMLSLDIEGKGSVDVDDTDERREVSLFALAHDGTGNVKDVMHLIISGASVNWKNPLRMGRTPLHEAVLSNYIAYAEALILNGADVSEVDERGWTPLHYAAYFNRLTMAKILLAAYGKQTANYIQLTDLRGLTAVGSENILPILLFPSTHSSYYLDLALHNSSLESVLLLRAGPQAVRDKFLSISDVDGPHLEKFEKELTKPKYSSIPSESEWNQINESNTRVNFRSVLFHFCLGNVDLILPF